MLNSIILQARKPNGFLGLLMARGMNSSHSKMTDWGLRFADPGVASKILDIGCGGDRTIHKLSVMAPRADIYGIDYSKQSIAISARVNSKDIRKGKVTLKEASVSHIPFEDDSFELITAIESYFFWPDLYGDMHEVLRVLRKDGTFLVISGEYKNDRYDQRNRGFAEKLHMHYHSNEELRDVLAKAGFRNVRMEENPERGWLCGIASK